MERTLITPDLEFFPEQFRELISSSRVYESSCSKEASVWYLEGKRNAYLKSAAPGALKREAEMTRYFHKQGLSAQVLAYEALERDWLLTVPVPGEDCTFRKYLDEPVRLARILGERLRMLHDLPAADCPVLDCTGEYIKDLRRGWEQGIYHNYFFPGNREEARSLAEEAISQLRTDTLLHGDYCLPNVMLDNWNWTGFVDVGAGGIGDRHVDLYWGIWSLGFNLKTDSMKDVFLDAYGRDKVNLDLLPAIAAMEDFR